jgi:2-methylfumaryl-CoA isomerase
MILPPRAGYTINAAFGLPYMTGPAGGAILPINHVLPAWDLTAGFYATFSLLVAERGRRITGLGQEVKVPLSNIAVSCLANLGQIAEVTIGPDRMRMGNDLFGALGRDFVTLDNHRLMVVAITPRQWSGLVDALGLEKVIAELEAAIGVTFKEDEGKRFEQRDRLYPLIEEAIGRRTSDDLASAFNSNGVCWSRYRTLKEALAEDETLWIEHGLVQEVQHPSGHRYATPGAPGIFGNHARRTAPSAPRLGEHTDEVLANVLGLSGFKIGQLHDRGLIGGPKA